VLVYVPAVTPRKAGSPLHVHRQDDEERSCARLLNVLDGANARRRRGGRGGPDHRALCRSAARALAAKRAHAAGPHRC
jgi:hypothetical protein